MLNCETLPLLLCPLLLRVIERGKKEGIYKNVRNQTEARLILWIGKDGYVYLGYWDKIDLYTAQVLLLDGIFGKSSIPRWAANVSIRNLAGFQSTDFNAGSTEVTNADNLVFSP